MGDGPAEILLHQLLLLLGALFIEIDNDELHSIAILFVQLYGAASLPLRVESTLAVHHDVGGFSGDRTVLHMVSGDEGTILAITRIIEVRIDFKVLSGEERR